MARSGASLSMSMRGRRQLAHPRPERPTPGDRLAISVVIPCYNEATNLRRGVLDGVAAFVEATEECREVLVVDDGSTDDSADLVERFVEKHPKFRLLREPHRGKAGAVVTGVLHATGDYVLFCDADQATPLEEMSKLRPYLLDGIDLVCGSRAERREGAPLVRKAMARGYMLVRRMLLDIGGITDSQCGFKAIRIDAARQIVRALYVHGQGEHQVRGATVTAAFDAELLFLAHRFGYTLKEVPVRWRHVGTPRVHPIVESWRGLSGLLKIRLAAWRGRYPYLALSSPAAGWSGVELNGDP